VLLERREDSGIAEEVAPRQKTLGVMLAYTPLHHLLLRDVGRPLVMTSGNNSDEPIAYRDDEAFEQLGDIADFFLVHNRPIHMRCDDSVARVVGEEMYQIRRSRGYAPAPLGVAKSFDRHILACGGELKNTFGVAKERYVFLSHHIGDLENYETLRSFREGVEHYCRLFDVQPELVAYDVHPEYLSTKYARSWKKQDSRRWVCNTTTRMSRVAWRTTSVRSRSGPSGWRSMGPVTGPTAPSGAGSSSRGV
jgi:hydrogenase maturation protein HypF